MAVILVDFDGTCVPALPEGGFSTIDTGAARVLQRLKGKGHKIILWTARNESPDNPYNYSRGVMREENSLQEAIRWFTEHGIILDGVNEVPGEREIIGTSRKILGDYLIDDTSLGIPLIYADVEYMEYETGLIKKAYTYCVDWKFIESQATRLGLL